MKPCESEYEHAFASWLHSVQHKSGLPAGFLPWDAYRACNGLWWATRDQNGIGKTFYRNPESEHDESILEFVDRKAPFKQAWKLMRLRLSRLREESARLESDLGWARCRALRDRGRAAET